jgi:hypothetical protein
MARRLHQRGGGPDDGGRGGDGDGRHGRDGEQPDLRGLLDAEPDDQQAEVRQGRQGPQERHPGLDDDADPRQRAHEQPDDQTGDDAQQ